MRLVRAILAGVMLALLACGSSNEDSGFRACAACGHPYTSCSFEANPESVEFHIEKSFVGGCSGTVQGAPVHLVCEPLQFCWDKTGNCAPVTYVETGLSWPHSVDSCG